MMRLHIGYPNITDEMTVLREQRAGFGPESLQSVVSAEQMIQWQEDVDTVKVDDSLLEYLARIVHATRESSQITLGASTRGALALRRAAQGRAWMEGRDYCVPDDIKEMVIPVLAHRILVKEGYESAGFQHEQETRVLRHVLARIEVPL
jgi:MoxR-like ATPase